MKVEILKKNIENIKEKISKSAEKSGKKEDDIILVCVTKSVNIEVIEALSNFDIKHIGENRIQNAGQKYEVLKGKDLIWHMIGHLQRNKINPALEIFDYFHSIDSVRLAESLAKKSSKKISILLEVNTSGEDSKYGLKPCEVEKTIDNIIGLEQLDIQGFMTMAPFTENMNVCRKCFENLRKLSESMSKKFQCNFPHLSMGMTRDFEVAIEEGATMVRIGTAFFEGIYQGAELDMPVLVVERGNNKGSSINFTGETITVGRDNKNDLKLSGTLISRNHFRIFTQEGNFYIEDLGSRNGTQLNGRFIDKPIRLFLDSRIIVGEYVLFWLDENEISKKDNLINQNLGGYLITKKIGRGGMGTVYKAHQLSLDRPVALKMLSAELGKNKNFINKFIQEARSCALLNHPNVIQVFDVGESEGYNFYSMEYAPNGSLQDKIDGQKKMPVETAIPYMLDTVKGLEYAEKKQIVHQDIKPDNLMIGEGDIIKICDLGLAKRLDQNENKEEKSQVFGTPHFISPEQAQGQEVDHRADIYSLGASFYRILAGVTPFEGKTSREIIMKHILEKPKPLKNIVPEIPDGLSKIIERMMKKKPSERYSSNSEIVDDIENLKRKLERKTFPKKKISGMTPYKKLKKKKKEEQKEQKGKKDSKIYILYANFALAAIVLLVLGIIIIQKSFKTTPKEKHYYSQKDENKSKKIENLKKEPSKDEKKTQEKEKNEKSELAKQLYKNAQNYEIGNPKNYDEILNHYKKALNVAQGDLLKKIYQDIERINQEKRKLELLALKYKNTKQIKSFNESIDRLIKEKRFEEALFRIAQNTGVFPDLCRKREEETYREIDNWIESIKSKIKKELNSQNFEKAEIYLSELKSKKVPIIQEKARIIEEYIEKEYKKVKQNKISQHNKLFNELYPKLRKHLNNYDFEKATRLLKEYYNIHKAEEIKLWGKYIKITEKLFDIIENKFKQGKHETKRLEVTKNIKKFLPAMAKEKDYVLLNGIRDYRLVLKIKIMAGGFFKKTIPLSCFSPIWFYENILNDKWDITGDDALKIAVYCYMFRLYSYSRIYCGIAIQNGNTEAKDLKNKLINIEKEATDNYNNNLIPLYKELKNIQTNPDLATEEEFAEKIEKFESFLKKFQNKYKYTIFFQSIK